MYKLMIQRILRICLMIVISFICYFTTKYVFAYIYPFIIAFIGSFLINPIVTMIVNTLKIPRPIATLLVLSSTVFFMSASIIFLMTELIQSSTDLAEKLPIYFEQVMHFLSSYFNDVIIPYYQQFLSIISSLNSAQQDAINQYIQEISEQITITGASILKNSLLMIPEWLAILPQSLTSLIVALIATFLMTNDWQRMTKWLKDTLPARIDRASQKLMSQLKKSLFGFIKAQFILVFISGMMIYIGLLVLHVNYALTITLFAMLTDLLPLVGTGIIFIPWIIYLFLSGNYSLTISLIILYMIIIIVRQILEPKILSHQIGINPLLALFTLFICFQIWGVFGIVLTPLILILLSTAHQTGLFHVIWQFIKGDYHRR